MSDPIFMTEHYAAHDNFRWAAVDNEMTRRSLIRDIYEGAVDCVTEIWEINKAERSCVPITLEIAEGVETYGVQNHDGQFSYEVLTFLQNNGLRQYASAAE